MITRDEYPHRVERLRVGIERLGVDEAVLDGADHVTHLCGYSRYLAGPSVVVLTRDGRRALIVPRYEFEAAAHGAQADDVIADGDEEFLDFDPAPLIARACRSVLGPRLSACAESLPGWLRRSAMWVSRGPTLPAL